MKESLKTARCTDRKFLIDDSVYEGEFKDDKKHGQRKLTWVDGSVYEGEWKDCNDTDKGK